jgi:predicted HD superfamily hydrolase involved in NAD metabolism
MIAQSGIVSPSLKGLLEESAGGAPITARQWDVWQYKLQGFLPRPRYIHCLRVAEEAGRLARQHHQNEEKARLAGLLHDLARDLSFDTLLALAARFGLMVGPEERVNPVILHAPVGAALLRSKWGIKDEAVLKAVSLHTVAAPEMDDFCQLIYLADIIEPGRASWPGLNALRELSYRHLGCAMLLALEESFLYLKIGHTFIHPRAIAAYDFFARQFMGQESAKK